MRPWIAILLLLAGCATPTPPVIGPRYQLTIQDAQADVYLGDDDPNGNSYSIQWFGATNVDASITNISPYFAAMYQDITTTRWPYKRNHIWLSIDGGSNWLRRIGYGVATDPNRTRGEFIWSPPQDYSLLTSNALLRITDLDGNTWPQRDPSWPYDIPAGKYVESAKFGIYGAIMHTPVAGVIAWQGEGTQITWTQLGAGPVMDLYWLTPTSMGMDVSHWITTISNCVDGAAITNSKTISLNVPTADALRLVIVSKVQPRIHGYSQIFTVDP